MPRKISRSRLVLGALSFASVMALTLGVAAQSGFFQQNRNEPSRVRPAAQKAQPAGVTPKRLARLQEKIALVTGILDARQAEAEANGLASGWRQAYLEMLLPLSLDDLQQLGSAGSLSQLSTLAAETKVAATKGGATITAIGSSTEDLVYVPIAPCRYVDTRNVVGPINGTRGYDLFNNGSTYGGNAACNPTALFGVGENSFGALAMNFTIVVPTAPAGFGAIKPSAAAPATSAINWYEAGAILANQGIYTMDQTGSANEFVVETSSSVHVIIDIFGAFVAPEATALDTVVVSTALSFTSTFDFDSPACPTGYSYQGSGHNWTSGSTDVWFWQVSPNVTSGVPDRTTCRGNVNRAGASSTITCYAVCARVPGR